MADSARAPLRITIVQGPFLPVPPLRGGAIEKAMVALGREWARDGHAVTHLSRRFPGLPDAETVAGVRHVRVPSVDMPAGKVAFRWHELRYCLAVRRALPPGDVVLANLVLLPLLPLPRAAGRLFLYLARQPKRQVGLYLQAAGLLAASQAVADGVRRVAPWMAARTHVVHTPLANAFAVGTVERAREILYAGRIHPEKGIETAIDAFRRLAPDHPGWRLRLIGPWREAEGGAGAGYRDALRARAGDAAITIDEPIYDGAALAEAYARASLFAYPSV
ncbi:MAG: glycosyltransferase, partial [Alphaproteobacteria bacterium]